jgi:hypothetical protein
MFKRTPLKREDGDSGDQPEAALHYHGGYPPLKDMMPAIILPCNSILLRKKDVNKMFKS